MAARAGHASSGIGGGWLGSVWCRAWGRTVKGLEVGAVRRPRDPVRCFFFAFLGSPYFLFLYFCFLGGFFFFLLRSVVSKIN